MMSSSGMRISEALHLTFNDINIEKRNITIPSAFTKNGNTHHTYFTEEAKDTLLEWLKGRETYLKYSFYKSKYIRTMPAKRGTIIDGKDEDSDWIITKNGVEISNNDLIKEENRIFPHVTRACQGVVFKDVDTVKSLIEKTKTKTGLKVTVEIIDTIYETGRKASKGFKENMRIRFDEYLPRWNYIAVPQ